MGLNTWLFYFSWIFLSIYSYLCIFILEILNSRSTVAEGKSGEKESELCPTRFTVSSAKSFPYNTQSLFRFGGMGRER